MTKKKQLQPLRYEDLSDWLSVPTTARYLGIGRMTAYSMVSRGLLAHRRLGRRILIPRTAVAPVGADAPKAMS